MTLVCTGCRRRFDLIVDTPYTRTLAAFLSQCPHCGGVVERLSTLITAASTTTPTVMTTTGSPTTNLLFVGPVPDFRGLFNPPTPPHSDPPTVPYELTDADREFLRVNRIDPES